MKGPPAKAGAAGDTSLMLGLGDPLEEGMATYSSILAWRIPWIEETGGLQSTGSDMTEQLSKHTCRLNRD